MANIDLNNKLLIIGCVDIFYPIRIPKMFCDAGFRVATLSYEESMLSASEFIDCRFNWISSVSQTGAQHDDLLQQLIETILDYQPVMVIPGDAISLGLMVKLHQQTRESLNHSEIIVNQILNTSLSDQYSYLKLLNKPEAFDNISSLGVSTAPYERVNSSLPVYDFIEKYNLPIQLKSGPETLNINNPSDFDKIALFFESNNKSSVVCVKTTSEIHVVTLISCNGGSFIDAFAVKVIDNYNVENVPSVICESIDESLIDIAKFIVSKFELNGLVNIVFQMDANKEPQFVESYLFPYLTSHIGQIFGRNLAVSLHDFLSDKKHPTSENKPINTDNNCFDDKSTKLFALFPMAWQQGKTESELSLLTHDVPWNEPALLHRIMTKLDD